MEAGLNLTITTDFIRTGFNELVKIGSYRWHDKLCVWTFPIDRIKEVEAILGKPIEFGEVKYAEIITSRTPLPREPAEIPEFKGKGKFEIIERPKVFVIIEYRKVETDNKIEIKTLTHEIPSENVVAVRKAMGNINHKRFKDSKIPARRLQEEICKVLKIDRFNRPDSGTFDASKFFGNRTDYFHLYYYPLKVLAFKEEINHHKDGKITKLKLQSVQVSLEEAVGIDLTGAEIAAVP